MICRYFFYLWHPELIYNQTIADWFYFSCHVIKLGTNVKAAFRFLPEDYHWPGSYLLNKRLFLADDQIVYSRLSQGYERIEATRAF